MQASVAAFRARIGQSYEQLQAAGGGFLKLLDMLQEAGRVRAAIRESRKARYFAVPVHGAAGLFINGHGMVAGAIRRVPSPRTSCKLGMLRSSC